MEWALLDEQTPVAVVHAIRRGTIEALRPEKGFEVTTRNNTRESPYLCDIYIRYLPAQDWDAQQAAEQQETEQEEGTTDA